jgi:TRAP-type mannitol/chloroaromatic compound transport system permease large subunit
MAEDLLETVGQVFGPLRGGLAVAVILVGALLAATTGVVAAAVISMGLISLPIMLRYGYNRTIATGTITASGTLAQAIPPSLVLIVLADQLGRRWATCTPARCCPGLLLVGCYLLFVVAVAIVKPTGCRRCRPRRASTASQWLQRPPLAAGAAGLPGGRLRVVQVPRRIDQRPGSAA